MPIPDEARGIHLETPSGFPWGWCVVIMLGVAAVVWKADAAHELPWLRGLGWGFVITIAGGVLLGIGVNGMARAARRQEREKWQAVTTVAAIATVLHGKACGCTDWYPGDPEDGQYDDMATAVLALLRGEGQ